MKLYVCGLMECRQFIALRKNATSSKTSRSEKNAMLGRHQQSTHIGAEPSPTAKASLSILISVKWWCVNEKKNAMGRKYARYLHENNTTVFINISAIKSA